MMRLGCYHGKCVRCDRLGMGPDALGGMIHCFECLFDAKNKEIKELEIELEIYKDASQLCIESGDRLDKKIKGLENSRRYDKELSESEYRMHTDNMKLIYELKAALTDFFTSTYDLCKMVHHPKKDQHTSDEPCPVIERYSKLIGGIGWLKNE